jgi:glycosyltransferase involved in cell wall biosynthesis
VTVRLAFFDFAPARSDGPAAAATATVMEMEALRAFLAAQAPRLLTRVVPISTVPPGGRGLRRAAAFLARQVTDAARLLGAPEEALLLVYPKVPFLGQFSAATLPFAVAGYTALAVLAALRRQQLLVLVTDLPVEQARLLAPIPSSGALDAALDAFLRAPAASWSDRLRGVGERVLLRAADQVIALSPRMAEHLERKHGIPTRRLLVRGRNAVCETPAPRAADRVALDAAPGPRVLYSGDLVRSATQERLRAVIDVFSAAPGARLYLCGAGGEWLPPLLARRGLANVRYLGPLPRPVHDDLARRCDVGLLVYDFAYAHLVTTAKYSSYVACGLAVLSADLATLSACLAEDGVGEAVPASQLAERLGQWLADPPRWQGYRARARALAPRFTGGDFMQAWLEPVLRALEAR